MRIMSRLADAIAALSTTQHERVRHRPPLGPRRRPDPLCDRHADLGIDLAVIRDQISVVPATWSVSYRFLVGGLAMGAFALARRESFRLGTTGWLFAAGIGLFQFVLNFNFVYRAEAYITSGWWRSSLRCC